MVGESGSVGAVAAITVLAVILCVVVLGLGVRSFLRRRLVASASLALQELRDLNTKARPHLSNQPTIKHRFTVRVESKSKFDRFELSRFLSQCLLDNEGWFETELRSRLRAIELFSAYQVSVGRLAGQLGASGHPKLPDARFESIEKKLFERQQIASPRPSARVTAEVKYTSPQGRNSYSRRTEWTFDDLRQGLLSAQAVRARASSAEALRARERSLMTSGMRVSILRRDGYRCRMCGASRDEGVNLHVDHIVPVSRGGRTLPDNLQTLCQSCNLGKGNRFVG